MNSEFIENKKGMNDTNNLSSSATIRWGNGRQLRQRDLGRHRSRPAGKPSYEPTDLSSTIDSIKAHLMVSSIMGYV